MPNAARLSPELLYAVFTRGVAAGLTLRQGQVLLWCALHGEITAGALAQQFAIVPATLTGILDSLERRGLVVRQRSRDRRQRLVRVTAAGHAVIAALGAADEA